MSVVPVGYEMREYRIRTNQSIHHEGHEEHEVEVIKLFFFVSFVFSVVNNFFSLVGTALVVQKLQISNRSNQPAGVFAENLGNGRYCRAVWLGVA
jgi:hypothetical protein